MIFLILVTLFTLFMIAAIIGAVAGLAIGVVRYARDPWSLVMFYKNYFAAKLSKIHGR